MKEFLPAALALACVVLVVSLVVIKHGDDAQHENDASALADLSNQLTSAQSQIITRDATILTFSNNLDASQSATLALSNHLAKAESTITGDAEQITNLNRQVAEVQSENQTLGGRVITLTNQVTDLMKQMAVTGASLDQTNKDLVQAYKDYGLLENRFRIDVAERLVLERKFNDYSELQAQLKRVKSNPAGKISAESIYSGLDVEVKSNGWVHVTTPN